MFIAKYAVLYQMGGDFQKLSRKKAQKEQNL
jgi:hypothetical protein